MIFAVDLFAGWDIHGEYVGKVWGGVYVVMEVCGVGIVCFVEVDEDGGGMDLGGGEVYVAAIAEGFVAGGVIQEWYKEIVGRCGVLGIEVAIDGECGRGAKEVEINVAAGYDGGVGAIVGIGDDDGAAIGGGHICAEDAITGIDGIEGNKGCIGGVYGFVGLE